jgi:uncharacterized tellurite resistance protein B-like protein
MTNQEIYDELGQRGVVVISCLMMMDFDGVRDEKEGHVIIKIANLLTKDEAEANELISGCVKAKNKLETPQNIMNFVSAGANLFKELDKDSKELYLACLKAVAEADGKVTEEEAGLYNLLKKIILGEL